MSYAAVASHNIPEGEMPKPDPNLADGHFSGETHASENVDGKINVLPAGTDPEHPNIHPEPVEKPEPIELHSAPEYQPSTSEAAPKPAPPPHKADIKLPESGAEWEARQAEEAKKKAKETGKDVADKAEDVAEKAEETGKEVADKAEETGKNVEKKVKEAGRDLEKKAKEAEKEIKAKGKEFKKKAQAELEEVESKLGPYWEKTKDVVLRPGTLGGLMGVVNVGILGTLGYFAYTRRDLPWDRRYVAGATAGTLALFGLEGYVTESYLSTPEGREEAERAKREGSRAYLRAKEIILRPGVFGGLASFFNLAVIGTVGYFAHKHWNERWDRRTVSAVSVGLLALSGLEGWAGKEYADKELPKH